MTAKDALALLKDGIGSRKIKSIVPVGETKGQSIVEVIVSTPPDSQLVLDASDVCKLRDQGFPLPVRTQPPASAISGSILLGLVSAPATESVQANGAERTKKRRGKRPPQAAQKPKELKAHFLLRSVESMIYFLGETQRDRYRRVGCDPVKSASEKWPDYLRKWPTDSTPRDLVLLRIDKLCGAVLPPKFRAFAETKFHDQFYYVRRREDTSADDLTLSTLTFLDELISLQTSPSSITAVTPVVDVGPK